MTTPTLDDILNGLTVVPARSSVGRSTEDVTLSRWLRIFDLYSRGLTRQMYEYVEALGFSCSTAADDLKWARAEWRELHNSPTHPTSLKPTCFSTYLSSLSIFTRPPQTIFLTPDS